MYRITFGKYLRSVSYKLPPDNKSNAARWMLERADTIYKVSEAEALENVTGGLFPIWGEARTIHAWLQEHQPSLLPVFYDISDDFRSLRSTWEDMRPEQPEVKRNYSPSLEKLLKQANSLDKHHPEDR